MPGPSTSPLGGYAEAPRLRCADRCGPSDSAPERQLAASDELWHNYTIEIQRELAAELIASKAFSQVLDSTPTAPPADALMVSGRITQVARWRRGAPLPAGWSAWAPVAHT